MRPIIVTMVHCNAAAMRAGMNAFRRTAGVLPPDTVHVFLDQHYALRHDEVRKEILHWLSNIPCQTVLLDRGYNMGLHHGLNYAISTQQLADDDIVIGYDPDEQPRNEGWLQAMLDVFAAEPRMGWLSITGEPAMEQINKMSPRRSVIGGHRVVEPNGPIVNHVTGFRGKAIKDVGAFNEPHAFYGCIESEMQPKYAAAGWRFGHLEDFRQDSGHGLHDPQYTAWKFAHTQRNFYGDFSAFLRANGGV